MKLATFNFEVNRGQEVKCLSFDILFRDLEIFEVSSHIQTLFEEWLFLEFQAALNVDLDISEVSSYQKSDGRGLFLTVKNIDSSEVQAREVSVANEFSHGLETTILRVICDAGAGRVSLQIRTFMFSIHSAAVLGDIPRISDSLPEVLASSSNLALQVEGLDVHIKYQILDTPKSAEDLRSKANIPVIFVNENTHDFEYLYRSELLGRTLLAKISDKINRAGSVDYLPQGKLAVLWDSAATKPIIYDLKSERFLFLGQLRAWDRSSQAFDIVWQSLEVEWRLIAAKASHVLAPISKKQSPDLAMLEAAISEAEEAKQAAELASFAASQAIENAKREVALGESLFEAEARKLAEIKEKYTSFLNQVASENYRLLASLGAQPQNKEKISFRINLDKQMIRGDLNSLTNLSGGAIVFTERAGISWSQAFKDGNTSTFEMETALDALSKFSLEYRAMAGAIGEDLQGYLKRMFKLDYVSFDGGLPEKEFLFEGEIFNQEKHVRADAAYVSGKLDLGRIHFDLDKNKKRLVVNHIGGKMYVSTKS
jgi:hypothetical protein